MIRPSIRPAPGAVGVGLVGLCLLLSGCGDSAGGDQAARTDEAARPDTATAAAPGTAAAADATAEDLEAICEGIRNSLECARAIERDQLPGDERARRSGDTLFLAIAADDTVRLVDREGDASEVVRHSYQQRWRDPDLFVVHRQYYEGSEYLIIDGRNGEETTVPARPLLSPDGRRFAVLSLDLVAGYAPNVIQVWRLTGEGPDMEWETRPREWGAADGRWEAPDRLAFNRECAPDAVAEPPCGERQELVRGPEGWTVRPAGGDGGGEGGVDA